MSPDISPTTLRMRLFFLFLPLPLLHCLGPLSLFGSKYLFRQFSYPSSHLAGRVNRVEYARQFGSWGEQLIKQLGRGHHLGRRAHGSSEIYLIKPACSEQRSKLKTEYRKRRKFKKIKRTSARESDVYKLLWPRIFNIFTMLGSSQWFCELNWLLIKDPADMASGSWAPWFEFVPVRLMIFDQSEADIVGLQEMLTKNICIFSGCENSLIILFK